MENLLHNDVVVVKEFNPTNPDAPKWYKDVEAEHLTKTAFTPDADRLDLCLKCLKLQLKKPIL